MASPLLPSSSPSSLQVQLPHPLTHSSYPHHNFIHPLYPFPLLHRRRHQHHITRAADRDSSSAEPIPVSDAPNSSEPNEFESRLDRIRIKYRSGTGKKAEARKAKKGSTASSGSGIFLPPVPLKEPVSEGLKVDFGFSPYSERVNGRLAGVGIVALLLVELATGKGVINYHTPAIVFIQIYFMAAASALYLKYEKERVSIWP